MSKCQNPTQIQNVNYISSRYLIIITITTTIISPAEESSCRSSSRLRYGVPAATAPPPRTCPELGRVRPSEPGARGTKTSATSQDSSLIRRPWAPALSPTRTCHITTFQPFVSHLKNFTILFPNSGKDSSQCGGHDRVFIRAL